MRVLSGIQPTGRFHWGNYFGAIRQYINLQEEAEDAFYFIANLHALTTVRQPVREMAERATDLLIDALKKKPDTEQKRETPPEQNLENILEYQLMLRETVAATKVTS